PRQRLGPPTSYAALGDRAAAVKRAADDRRLGGFLWQGKQYEGLVVNVLEAMWGEGTDLVGADGRLLPDPRRAAAALAHRRALLTDGVSPPLVTAADEELTRREFGAGRGVFLRNWPYARALFETVGSRV